jgi:hypothetical protein
MDLKEKWSKLNKDIKKYLKELSDKARPHPLISLIFIFAVVLLVAIPYVQVHLLSGMTDNTAMAKQKSHNGMP